MEGDSSTPKSVSKASKRKADEDGARPSKNTVSIPGDASPKGKSALKPSHGAGKGAMTSSGPVSEGPNCLLTHKAYAVGEVGSSVKPTDLEPCDLVGTEDLEALALFDITKVCLLFIDSVWFYLLLASLMSALFSLLSLGPRQGSSGTLPCQGGNRHSCQEAQCYPDERARSIQGGYAYIQQGGEGAEGEVSRGRLSEAEALGGGDGFARESKDGWD